MSAFDIYPSRRNVPTEDIRVNAIVFPWRPRSREEEAAVQVAGHSGQSSTIPYSLWEMCIRMLCTKITRWDTSGEGSGNVRAVYRR